MLHKLREYIAKQVLIDKKEKVLLAVSGGIDSMVLLHLLLKEGYEVGVAHCNFQLRGKESNADEQFVKNACAEHKIPFFVKRFNTSQLSTQHKTGIQETARNIRYEWFSELMHQKGYDKLATAHQATDQLETIMLNLARGTGLKGLEGIPVKSGNLIRPLLFATRKEIETFAHKNQIRYREDSSNASDKYARNRVRLHMLPELLRINTQAVDHIRHTSEIVQEANAFIEAETSKWFQKHSYPVAEGVALEIKPLLRHKTPAFLLFYVLQPFGFNKDQVGQILTAIQGQPGKIFKSATHQLLKDRSVFIISPLTELKETGVAYRIETEKGKITAAGFELKWKKKKVPAQLPKAENKVCLDLAKLKFPLLIRPWKEGDRFQPLGMKGKKKLSDFLTDQKISRNLKEQMMVLVSDAKIAWVINQRIDDQFKVTAKTSEVLEMSCRIR